MEPKICPILGAGPLEINSNCKGERCALCVNGHCAFVDIAVSLAEITASTKNAASELFDIAARMP